MAAKGSGDSKIVILGALTLALAIAGVMLVKEPLRSSRPVGSGLEMKQTTGEQLVRARLWEDPLAAVQRGIRETSTHPEPVNRRSHPSHSVSDHSGTQLPTESKGNQHITVLLVTTSGDPYAESTESRIRDRYAVGTALGVACYVPEDEGHLSFIEGDNQDAGQALPYEWYRPPKTRVCGEARDPTRSMLVIWIPDEALRRGFFATLTSLSQALVCQEASRKSECLLTGDQRN